MQYGRPTPHPHACTYTVAHLVTWSKIHPHTSVCAHHMHAYTCAHTHAHNMHAYTHTRANLRDVEERNQVDKCSWELLPHLLQDLYKMLLKVIGGQEGNITGAPTKGKETVEGAKAVMIMTLVTETLTMVLLVGAPQLCAVVTFECTYVCGTGYNHMQVSR